MYVLRPQINSYIMNSKGYRRRERETDTEFTREEEEEEKCALVGASEDDDDAGVLLSF